MSSVFQRQKQTDSILSQFDFTSAIRYTLVDIAGRLSEFHHINMDRIAVSFSQTRVAGRYGVHASITPLRFSNGSRSRVQNGKQETIQRILAPDGSEYLYLLYIYVPRFLDLSFDEKLCTLIHELYHISPDFNGHVRIFEGRCQYHGPSRESYDRFAGKLAKKWIKLDPPASTYEYLFYDHVALENKFGSVRGVRISAPKIIRV